MKKSLLVSALFLGLSSLSVSAQNSPSWNYVDVNYQNAHLDQINTTAHGFHASAVASLNKNFFMSLQVGDMELSREDIGVKDLSIGIGLRSGGFTVTGKPADVFVQLRRGEVDADGPIPSLNANMDYWSVGTGFRLMVNDETEFAAMLSHNRMDDDVKNGIDVDGSTTSIGAQVRYFISPEIALQARGHVSKSEDQFGIGVMYAF